ncbi:Transmembrane channel-like protein 7, partial [Bulinus truncatus]
KHGAGVVSYFIFLRWIFALNLILFVLLFPFVVLPKVIGEGVALTLSNGSSFNESAICSSNYTVEDGTGVELFLSALDGTKWFEKTLLFYGHYSVQMTINYNLPVAYVLTAISCLVVSLFLMVRYTAKSFKETVLKSVNSSIENFTKVFIAWNFFLTNQESADLKKQEIFKDFENVADEKIHKTQRNNRLGSKLFVCRLYLARVLVNITITATLTGSGYLIYYVTAFSTEFSQDSKRSPTTSSWLLLLVNYLPSITITFCNALLPLLYELLVQFEDYSGNLVVKLTLIRTVVLRLESLVVLAITLYTEITCGTKDVCRISASPCPKIVCWETYVGQQFYKLVIMDFLSITLMVLAVEISRRFITSKCKFRIIQKLGPAQFNVPANVLDLIYGQCLVWLGLLFTPLLPGVVLVKCFIIFYIKKLSALVACPPVKTTYQTSGINRFFMIVLLLAFTSCSLPVLYIMFGYPPSRSCGPFRVQDYMHDCIKSATLSLPSVLSKSYNFVTSIAVTGTIILILLVVIYYSTYVISAHKENAKFYKKQLMRNGNEKKKLPLIKSFKPIVGDEPTLITSEYM